MGVGGTSPAPPRSAQMPGTSGGSSPQRGFLQAQPGSGVGGGSGPLTQRAFNSSGRPYGGGSGGGGGYDVRGMIADARSSLMGKVGGMFGGESAAAPAGGSYQFPTADAVKPRMRGMARGMDPEQAGAVLARPSLMLPKLSRGVDPNSPFYDTMESLPASQIALLTTSGRKATEKNKLSQQINATGDVYQGKVPDYETLVRGLTHAKKNSALGQLMKPPKVGSALDPTGGTGDYYTSPLTTATDTLSGLIGAIGQASNLDDRVISAQMDEGNYLIDKFGGKALKSKPSKMPMLNKKVGKKLY
jgi:hypothetical protein